MSLSICSQPAQVINNFVMDVIFAHLSSLLQQVRGSTFTTSKQANHRAATASSGLLTISLPPKKHRSSHAFTCWDLLQSPPSHHLALCQSVFSCQPHGPHPWTWFFRSPLLCGAIEKIQGEGATFRLFETTVSASIIACNLQLNLIEFMSLYCSYL